MTVRARLRGVTRTFGDVVAVDGLSLDLRAGSICGLLGPNGSGKTTTLKTLLGLTSPDKGEVELLGGPPTDDRRSRVGYVPESRALANEAKVRDLLVFFARMRGFDKSGAAALADTWIGRLELGDKAAARVKTLSNGQQQKVQVALALMCEPELILLDEPLTGLDPTHQELVFSCIRDAAAGGAAVLLSTHRLHEAEVIVDHVVLMAKGNKVLDQPLHDALEEAFDDTWRVRHTGDDGWIEGPGVVEVTPSGEELHVRLDDAGSLVGLLERAAKAGAPLRAIEAVLPSLHELYLTRVSGNTAERSV